MDCLGRDEQCGSELFFGVTRFREVGAAVAAITFALCSDRPLYRNRCLLR